MQLTIPEAVLLIGSFFLFVTALILRGLLAGYNYSLGSMLVWLAKHLTVRVPLPFHRSVTVRFGSPFGVLNEVIVETMQAGIRDTEKYLAYTWHAAEKLLRFITQAIDTLARETAATFDWLIHVRLRDILAAANPATLIPLLIHKLLPAILAHVKAGTVRIVHTVTHTVEHTVTTVARKAAAVALPSPWAFPKFRRWAHDIAKWRHVTGLRLTRLETLLTAAGLALAVAKLWGVRPACIKRNGNIGRTMRRLCGVPTHLLDDFLGLLADFYVLENVCDVLPWVEAAASAVAVPFVETVTTLSAGNKGCLSKSAPRYAVPKLYLPSVVGSLVEV